MVTRDEALERVRALCAGVQYLVPGDPATWGQYSEGAFDLAEQVKSILDAVTPDVPVTVETAGGASDGQHRAWVAGRCPACGRRGLFVGAGGYVTCSQSDCPDPGAPHDALTPATSDVPVTVERAYFQVASVHHLHDGRHCLCGFDTLGRARSAPEHILDEYRAALTPATPGRAVSRERVEAAVAAIKRQAEWERPGTTMPPSEAARLARAALEAAGLTVADEEVSE